MNNIQTKIFNGSHPVNPDPVVFLSAETDLKICELKLKNTTLIQIYYDIYHETLQLKKKQLSPEK